MTTSKHPQKSKIESKETVSATNPALLVKSPQLPTKTEYSINHKKPTSLNVRKTNKE